jgi:hypothetical protein
MSPSSSPASSLEKNEEPASTAANRDLFWSENPNILIASYEMFPSNSLTMNQNLNATTRMTIVLSVILYVLTRRITVLIIFAVTIFFIYIFHYMYSVKRTRESFENSNTEAVNIERLKKLQKDLFDEPGSLNPFSNVLNSDIEENPRKKPAPPFELENVQKNLMETVKQTMVANNPTFPNIDKRLLQNMGDKFEFEQSLQPFYSNPATTVPNDQNSFADFCYGSMISCKEGNLFACARNNEEGSHYNKY